MGFGVLGNILRFFVINFFLNLDVIMLFINIIRIEYSLDIGINWKIVNLII